MDWTMPAEWIAAIEEHVRRTGHAGRLTVHVDLGPRGVPNGLSVQPPAQRVPAPRAHESETAGGE